MTTRTWTQAITMTVVGLSLALVLVLARQNRVLDAAVGKLNRERVAPTAGSFLPGVATASTHGDSLVIGTPRLGSRQFLVFFSTSCPFCKASVPAWDALARRLGSVLRPHVALIGVALDTGNIADFERRASFPLVRLPEKRFASIFRIRAVPALVLVDSAGQVLFSRVGAVTTGAEIDSIARAATKPFGGPRQGAKLTSVAAGSSTFLRP